MCFSLFIHLYMHIIYVSSYLVVDTSKVLGLVLRLKLILFS